MAQLHSCAVLAVNQVATSLLKGATGGGVRKAMLKPSLSGNGWDAGVQNRILLYQDFAPRWDDDDGGGSAEELNRDRDRKGGGMRFAEVVKVSGKVVGTDTATATATATSVVVPFIIEDVSIKSTFCKQVLLELERANNCTQAGLREIRRPTSTSLPSSTPLLTSSIATEEGEERVLKRKADEIADSEDEDEEDDKEDDDLGSEDDLGVLPDDFLA